MKTESVKKHSHIAIFVSAHSISSLQLLRHSSELVRILLKTSRHPRQLTSQYLHKKKKLSIEVKAAISSLAYHSLRHLRLAYFIASGDDITKYHFDADAAQACTAAALYLDSIAYPTQIRSLDTTLHHCNDEIVSIAGLNTAEMESRLTGLRVGYDSTQSNKNAGLLSSTPSWVMELWERESALHSNAPNPLHLACGLLSSAPLTLRVNTIRADTVSVIQSMQTAGISVRRHRVLSDAIVPDRRNDMTGSAWERDGQIEIQDAGSQLIAHALAPQPGWNILDACAGAGGKTLHLLNLLAGTGSVTASDTQSLRLRALKIRAARLGVHDLTVFRVPEQGELLPVFGYRQFNAVLVDAPCSGYGTARRNPLVKWRLQKKSVEKIARTQLDILTRNAALVQPGGVLLYATCSLLPTENERVVERFLASNKHFTAEALTEAFSIFPSSTFRLGQRQSSLTLDPAFLDSDGFFIARMRREQ